MIERSKVGEFHDQRSLPDVIVHALPHVRSKEGE
jgi:hypothetical protein